MRAADSRHGLRHDPDFAWRDHGPAASDSMPTLRLRRLPTVRPGATCGRRGEPLPPGRGVYAPSPCRPPRPRALRLGRRPQAQTTPSGDDRPQGLYRLRPLPTGLSGRCHRRRAGSAPCGGGLRMHRLPAVLSPLSGRLHRGLYARRPAARSVARPLARRGAAGAPARLPQGPARACPPSSGIGARGSRPQTPRDPRGLGAHTPPTRLARGGPQP